MKFNRLLFFVATALLVFMGSLCFAADFTFKLANVMPPGDHVSLAVDQFAKIVGEKSSAKIKIETFHGGQLGSGKATYESVQGGFLDIAGDSYANLFTLTPAFEPFHLPYIFESRNQQLAAFRNPQIRAKIDADLAKVGLKWLMALEYAPRQIGTAKKDIQSMDDLKGLKLRASRSPLEIAAQKSWGATGVTVDWPQVPESLRMGMVDGETVGYDSMFSAKHHVDSIKYVTEINFQSYGVAIVVSTKWWEKLPEDVKVILTKSAIETEKWHEKMFAKYVNDAKKAMIAAGVKVTVPSDSTLESFKKAIIEKVWPKFVGESIDADFVKLIQSQVGEKEAGQWFKE